jgi:uncharacterized transporter YbjL
MAWAAAGAFAVIQRVLSLAVPVAAAKIAGYHIGSAAGLFAGSQTISASMGLATDAINRLGLPADQAKQLLDAMPTAYAVTYIFGTIGSAIILATPGPKLLGLDLVAHAKIESNGYALRLLAVSPSYRLCNERCASTRAISSVGNAFDDCPTMIVVPSFASDRKAAQTQPADWRSNLVSNDCDMPGL